MPPADPMPSPPAAPQPLRRTALHEQVATRLRDMIVHGALRPGERVSEATLCEQLDISRTPLREALKTLAAEGLVELRPNRGAVITPLRQPETLELFETIAGMERIAAEHAAERLSLAELRKLEKLHDRMEACHNAGDLKPYFACNQEIHRLIVAGAHNKVLQSTHGFLHTRMSRARYFALFVPQRWSESVAEHRRIMDALRARDGARAGAELGAHVWRTGQIIAQAVDGLDSVAS
ncbi:MAG: GntR family transcriptional regulator [Pararhodobacter sp.]|nr:GntR family transcriptional regulator [Pararhodobacter sp.]